ncbi:MAG: flagellar hook-associated protein 3 [Cellulosilyticum sp.]|nr:flagellar hook-associated protein 3 [Cellulosilyticum sp.]
MRVTNGMIRNTTLNGLYNNMNALSKTYAQMSTGKKIQTVSDDPIIAGRALKLTTTVLETTQYESNVKEAMSWMENTESALDNMTKMLREIRTKCEQAANGTYEKDSLDAIKTDIEQLWTQLQDEANVTYGGRYVFSGYKTDTPLIKDGAVNPDIVGTDGQSIQYEIGVNSTITVNTEGMDDIFNKLYVMFNGEKDAAGNVVTSGIFTDCETITDSTELNKRFSNRLDEIDGYLAEISEKTSDLGSRMSRIDYVQERLGEQKIAYKALLTETEDIDVEEVYTKFNVQYATYQSALQATSKIITNTLADYL